MIFPLVDHVITQYFGENPNDYLDYGYPGHNGLDLSTRVSPPYVFSVEAGIVEKVGYEAGGYGKYIVVSVFASKTTLETYRAYYAHLSSVLVAPGQNVSEGQIIAVMGSTGNSTGPHLHIGIRLKPDIGSFKGFIDPLSLLNGQSFSDCYGDDVVMPPASKPKKPVVLPGSVVIGRHGRTMYRMKRYF